jgi:hypothetical protein
VNYKIVDKLLANLRNAVKSELREIISLSLSPFFSFSPFLAPLPSPPPPPQIHEVFVNSYYINLTSRLSRIHSQYSRSINRVTTPTNLSKEHCATLRCTLNSESCNRLITNRNDSKSQTSYLCCISGYYYFDREFACSYM